MLLKDILIGWGNLVKDRFGLLDQNLKEKAELRLLNCHYCHVRDGHICSAKRVGRHIESGNIVRGCGCSIAPKALAPDSKCPLGKWK